MWWQWCPKPFYCGEIPVSREGKDPSPAVGHAISGGFWTVVERIVAQASQLVIFIAAARLLGPADFGAFALVSAAAILLLRVAEFGWAQYVMAWPGDNTVPRQVLMIAIFAGLGLALVGGGIGLTLPHFGVKQIFSHLVLLFSLWVFLATISSVQKGIMIWQSKLKASAASETIGELVGLTVALLTLFSGFGVLSLAFGRLAFQSVHIIISFSSTRLSPIFGLKGSALREMFTFCGQLFVWRMVLNLRLYLATFLIGGILGPAAVGYFRAAERLVGAVAEVISTPTQVLSWRLFRDSRDAHVGKLDGFQRCANIFFKVLIAVSAPVFIWIAITGPELVSIILGPEWLPVIPVIAVLALARAVAMPVVAAEAILSLAGHVRRLIPLSFLHLGIGVLLNFFGARLGFYAVAWSQVLISLVVLTTTNALLNKYGAIHAREIVRGALKLTIPILLGSITLLLARQVANTLHMSVLANIVTSTLISAVIYVSALTATEPVWRDFVLVQIWKKKRFKR